MLITLCNSSVYRLRVVPHCNSAAARSGNVARRFLRALLPLRLTPISLAALAPPTAIVSLARAPPTSLRVKMNSDPAFDSFHPKIEVDIDRDYRVPRLTWSSEMTKKLIETLESDCHVLWNTKDAFYKDKASRLAKIVYLADMFGTTSEEIHRKIHNLRTQYNNELRKIKRRQETGERSVGPMSGWEHFEAMSFLKTAPALMIIDPLDTALDVGAVNIALAEFQAEEEQEFGLARARYNSPESSGSGSPGRKKPTLRVAASAPPPMPLRALPIMWPDQPTIQPSLNADECQIFGDFVASELRTLRCESRKRLKRAIQKAILDIGEEEDVNITSS